jgi:hypothetical protein
MPYAYALQRTNTKNWKQIFPEKELRGHSPFHILPILLQEICAPILGIYKSLIDT